MSRTCSLLLFLQCFLVDLVNSGSQGGLTNDTLSSSTGTCSTGEKLLGDLHQSQAVLNFLHPVGTIGKAHPSLWYFCLYTIEEEMQNARFNLILPNKVNVSLLIWYRVTAFCPKIVVLFCLESNELDYFDVPLLLEQPHRQYG